jgi:3-dehydroquinate synthase
MALTLDDKLFSIFENEEITLENIEKIITRSIEIKKAVVESDERESGERKILNFGHTLGHGIEAGANLHGLYHGECIALGMLPMCNENVKARIKSLLNKYQIPTDIDLSKIDTIDYIKKDKKASGSQITVVYVCEIGSFEFRKIDIEKMQEYIKRGL